LQNHLNEEEKAMKRKFIMIILIGLCLPFISRITAFADTNAMIEKQKEIDHFIFEEKKDELTQKGITVTTTTPLENQVEIGITPFTEENANYFYKAFGRDVVKVVEGVQNETMSVNSQKGSSLTTAPADNDHDSPVNPMSIIALLIVLSGTILMVLRKKNLKSN
jgi:hypothetical protein